MSESPGGGEVIAAARTLAAIGLVDAFGHVSARTGESAMITPALPLGTVTSEEQLIELPLSSISSLPPGAPREAWIHWAIYRARPDVAAICRAQPPAAIAAAAIVAELPALLGQGALAGAPVPVHPSPLLIRDPGMAAALTASLGDAPALIMRGNGALATGSTPGRAVARIYLLERAADVYLRAAAAGEPQALGPEEATAWQGAAEELLARLWDHLRNADDR